MSGAIRLAAICSHFVQYRAPLFRHLAGEPWLDLEVLYCHDYGRRSQQSTWGVADFKWDVDLESGYRWRLLRNVSPRPGASSFLGEINPELFDALYGRRYDAVLFEGWHTATSAAGLLLGRASPTPILLLCETNLLDPPGSPARAWIKPPLVRALLRAPSAVLAIGSQNRTFYRHSGVPEERIFPFPYTIDVASFLAGADRLAGERRRLREGLGFSDEDTVFLFVAGMMPRKDPLGLLSAYRRLLPGRVGLVLVGAGPQLDEVRAASAGVPGVRVEGFQNQTDLPRYYAAADVFVLPSLQETWGLVINEAMCFGLPIVTTWAVGSAYDLVLGRGTGLVVRPARPAELGDAMARLAGDPALRRAMGDRSREVIRRHTYAEDAEGLHAALRSL